MVEYTEYHYTFLDPHVAPYQNYNVIRRPFLLLFLVMNKLKL